MVERLVLVPSDIENHNLLNLVLVFRQEIRIGRNLKEVFVEDSLAALKIDEREFSVYLAVEVKRSAVFVFLRYKLLLVEDRLCVN